MNRLSVLPPSLVFVITALTGCAPDGPEVPPQVRVGRDECVECGMLISDDRFAAAHIVEVQGVREALFFDDIGCMLNHDANADNGAKVLSEFVADHSTSAWLKAPDALYLAAPKDRLATPMGFGLAAFADRAGASSAQSQFGGEIMAFEQLRSSWPRPSMANPTPGSHPSN